MCVLTVADYEVLLEALEAWVKRDKADSLAEGIAASMVGSMGPEVERKVAALYEKNENKRAENRKNRSERATLLAAKLIMLRGSATVEEEMTRG